MVCGLSNPSLNLKLSLHGTVLTYKVQKRMQGPPHTQSERCQERGCALAAEPLHRKQWHQMCSM